VGTLESAHQIASGTLYNFSEQQVIDCSLANLGCNGGWQNKAYNYYKTSFAMTTAEYPYTGRDGSCKYNAADTTGKGATGYVNVAANDPDAMKIALAGRPLAVSIEADQTLFQNY
jgi:cathepsin L